MTAGCEGGDQRRYRGEIDGVDHAFAITRDITAPRAPRGALRASEERFRSLLAGSRDPILVDPDAAGVLTYCSPGVEYC